MNKVMYIGNFIGNSGPVIVNKQIRKNLKGEAIIIDNIEGTKQNIIKVINNMKNVKCVHLSGINGYVSILAIILSKFYRKDLYYTCHGSVKLEDKKNNRFSFKERLIEKIYLSSSKKIVLISNTYKKIFQENYKKFNEKIVIINNGYDYNEELYIDSQKIHKKNMIISLGGGRSEKGNFEVCKKLDKINDKTFKYVIIGEEGPDTDKIKSYDFVEYLGTMPNEMVIDYLKEAKLYIQNSEFETFGIAPLEAINAGCDILISENMGVIDLLQDIKEDIAIKNLAEQTVSKLKKPKEYKLNVKGWGDILKEYKEVWYGKA
ncbi:MAG: glycosyltransferase family 4 protein [Clostridium sp.]